MCKQNGLLIRGTSYFFQARIPKDCVEFFPKAVLREKLSATSLTEAKAQVRQRWADLEATIARIRATGSPLKQALTPEDANRILAAYTASRLEAHEEDRLKGMDEDGFERTVQAVAHLDTAERNVAAKGDIRGIQGQAADWLQGYGYSIPLDSPEFRSFAMRFAEAGQPLTQALLKQQRGEFVELPQVAPKEPQKATSSAPKLSEVITYFLENYADKTRPMYRKHRSVLPVFLDCVGDRPIDQLKQMDIEDFAKTICKLPPRAAPLAKQNKLSIKALSELTHPKTIAPKTFEDTFMASVRPFIAASRRIFGDSGFPANLTTEGVVYRGAVKAGGHKQRPMTPEELQTLVDALQPFAAGTPEAHKMWLPMVALHTGARINEICQLNPQVDIGVSEGVPYFHFTDETEGDERIRKSVKNAASRRRVPIHPDLISAGFMEYVEATKTTKAKLLFPHWAPSKQQASPNAEDWFSEFLRDNGLRDDTPGRRVVGFHAFRSTFINRAKVLGVQGADNLTGHTGNSSAVVRGYQDELPMPQKLEILKQIKFELKWPDQKAWDKKPA